MMYELPTSIEIGGNEREIRSDYRAILDICVALSDPSLGYDEKCLVALDIFYLNFEEIPQEYYEESLQKCFWFINCGDKNKGQKSPKLMDWEQDFKYIVAPINRVAGKEIRATKYMHWWTFISYYYEIGECLFVQIVRIREKKAKGKPLDKSDKEFYRKNRDLVDIKTHYSDEENDLVKMWTGG